MGVIAHTLSQNSIFDKLHHLWNCSNPHRLKPAPLNTHIIICFQLKSAASPSETSQRWGIFLACYFFRVVPEFRNPSRTDTPFFPARTHFVFRARRIEDRMEDRMER